MDGRLRIIPVLLLALGACNQESSDNAPSSNPFLVVGTTALTFDDTFVGQARPFLLTIQNQGATDGLIESAVGIAPPFAITSPLLFPMLVPAFSTVTITLTFTPAAEVVSLDVLLLNTTAPNAPQFTITVTGRGTRGDVTPFTVEGLFGLSVPLRLSDTRAVFWTLGPDLAAGTVDDRLVFLDISTSPVTLFEMSIGFAFHPPVPADDSHVFITGPGPDLVLGTADDELRRVNVLPATFSATAIAVGALSASESSIPAVLSPARAAVLTGGAVPAFATGDEDVTLVDFLLPGVDKTVVGTIPASPATRPSAFADERTAFSVPGADGVFGTGDDAVAFLSYSGGDITTSILTFASSGTPFDPARGRALNGTISADVSAAGPDGIPATADDAYVRHSSGGVTDSDGMPGLNSRPFRFTTTRAAVLLSGPDLVAGTSDDALALLTISGGGFGIMTIDNFTLPGLPNDVLSAPFRNTGPMGEESFFVASSGADGAATTADDGVHRVLISGATPPLPTLLQFAAAGPLSSVSGTAVAFDHERAGAASMGADALPLTADDGIGFADFRSSPAFTVFRALPGLAATSVSRATFLSSRDMLVGTAGPDMAMGTADDQMVRIRIPPPLPPP